jgi:hypothetical protein
VSNNLFLLIDAFFDHRILRMNHLIISLIELERAFQSGKIQTTTHQENFSNLLTHSMEFSGILALSNFLLCLHHAESLLVHL